MWEINKKHDWINDSDDQLSSVTSDLENEYSRLVEELLIKRNES